jgi:hypothetical protein
MPMNSLMKQTEVLAAANVVFETVERAKTKAAFCDGIFIKAERQEHLKISV